MTDLKDVPMHLQLVGHVIGVISLWVVITYFDKIGELIANYVEAGEVWFTPLKFIVAYILLQYVFPRVGFFIYNQISG